MSYSTAEACREMLRTIVFETSNYAPYREHPEHLFRLLLILNMTYLSTSWAYLFFKSHHDLLSSHFDHFCTTPSTTYSTILERETF